MKTAIIIPTKGQLPTLFKCLKSIDKHVKADVHIFVADTGSSEEEVISTASFLTTNITKPATLLTYDYYHFGKINNDVVNKYCGEYDYLVFMNNDIELWNDAVSLMLDFESRVKDCGTLGARLHFPNGTIQHLGIELRKSDKLDLGHVSYKMPLVPSMEQEMEVLGNTAALMGISTFLFNIVGGFSEKYTHCFEDVHLNVDCLLKGYKNYCLGYISALHSESITRKQRVEDKLLNDAKLIREYLSTHLEEIPAHLIQDNNHTYTKAEWSLENSKGIISEFSTVNGLEYQNPTYPDVYEKQLKFEARYGLQSDNGKLHILMVGNNSVCAKIRMEMPAKYLNRIDGVEVFPTLTMTPELLNWCHMVVWSPYSPPEMLEAAKFLNKMGVPQVWEADDNLFTIGPYNRASYAIKRDDVLKWLEVCGKGTFTREALGNFYKTLYPQLEYFVLPNCVDFEVWPKTTYKPNDLSKGEVVRVGWTGCDSHYEDLEEVVPSLHRLKAHYGDKVEIVIFGWNGVPAAKFNKPSVFGDLKFTYVPGVSYSEYASALANLNLDLAFIPLADNKFNRTGKSNLKYLDFAACKVPCVVSKCSLYDCVVDNVNGLVVDYTGLWDDKLWQGIEDVELRKRLSRDSYEYVEDNYDMAKNVHMWAEAYIKCADKYRIR
jgi:O-antigen biosynthesis protein